MNNANQIIDLIRDYINESLSLGPKGMIGVDIGMSAIKIAEVTKLSDGNFRLNRYVSVPLPEGAIIEDEIQNEDEVISAIHQAVKELRTPYKNACVGIAGPNTLIKKLQLAGGSKEEIEDQVHWETEQYLPFSIEDGNISYSMIGENSGGGIDVIVGAAKKSLVNNFKEIVGKSPLKVKIVDLIAAATLNVFEQIANSNGIKNEKKYIIIDFGAQKSHFFIHYNGSLMFFKEIAIGGNTITEEIQRKLGVSYAEAESLKIQGDGKGNIPEEILEIINMVLDSFFSEIKKTLDFWSNSNADESFDICYITGGSSQIAGFTEALADLMDMKVELLNPFNSMSYNQSNIEEEQINEIMFKGITAIGLGMRSLKA